MRTTPALPCLLALAATLAALPATARAQGASPPAESGPGTGEGRAHFERGVGLFRQQDYEGALAEFLRAHELSGRASVLFNIAATYQALHRYPEALEAVRRFLREADAASAARRAEAETARRELEALVAYVRVRVAPPGAGVMLDGRALATAGGEPVVVGPGRHVIEAAREGYRAAREEVVIASGETREVRLALARAAEGASPSSSSSQGAGPATGPARAGRAAPPPRAGISPVYFGVAAAATGAFAVASITCGALTVQTSAEFETRARDDAAINDLAARGRTLAVSADLLGGFAIAAGIATVILATQTQFTRPARPRAEVSAAAAPGGAFGVVVRTRF